MGGGFILRTPHLASIHFIHFKKKEMSNFSVVITYGSYDRSTNGKQSLCWLYPESVLESICLGMWHHLCHCHCTIEVAGVFFPPYGWGILLFNPHCPAMMWHPKAEWVFKTEPIRRQLSIAVFCMVKTAVRCKRVFWMGRNPPKNDLGGENKLGIIVWEKNLQLWPSFLKPCIFGVPGSCIATSHHGIPPYQHCHIQ